MRQPTAIKRGRKLFHHMKAKVFQRRHHIGKRHRAKAIEFHPQNRIAIARIAAIQGAKRTPDLIPLAHPLIINKVAVEFVLNEAASQIECSATVETFGRTGVEMEALTAVSAGLLTIYDMVKSVDRGMTISAIRLLEKSGGKSGDFKVP